jgi:hypothetical protein
MRQEDFRLADDEVGEICAAVTGGLVPDEGPFHLYVLTRFLLVREPYHLIPSWIPAKHHQSRLSGKYPKTIGFLCSPNEQSLLTFRQ